MLNGINVKKFEDLYNMGKIEKKTYQAMIDIKDRLKNEQMPRTLDGDRGADSVENELEDIER